MIISLYLCITLVWSEYEKWENTPVIVSFASKETPIWQIPFPAVTICPENKVVPRKFNYTNYLFRKMRNETLAANMWVNQQLEIECRQKDILRIVFQVLLVDTRTLLFWMCFNREIFFSIFSTYYEYLLTSFTFSIEFSKCHEQRSVKNSKALFVWYILRVLLYKLSSVIEVFSSVTTI